MKCVFHAKAQREFIEAIGFYERQRPGLGRQLARLVRELVDQIWQNPGRGHPIGPGARRCLVRRFPYQVIYVAAPESLLIIAVAHGRRQPDYWRGRLTGD